jgi:hypothetical protein
LFLIFTGIQNYKPLDARISLIQNLSGKQLELNMSNSKYLPFFQLAYEVSVMEKSGVNTSARCTVIEALEDL